MELTPPSLTRSPTFSPTTNRSTGSPPVYYPSPTLLAQHCEVAPRLTARDSCSMVHPLDHSNQTLPPPQDGRILSEWPPPSVATSTSSSPSMPNASSLDYGPFNSYDSPTHSSYGQEVYSARPHSHSSSGLQPPSLHSSGLVRADIQGPARHSLAPLHGSDSFRMKVEDQDQDDYIHASSPHFAMSRPAYGAEPYMYSGVGHQNYIAETHLPSWPRSQGQHNSAAYRGSSSQSTAEPEAIQQQGKASRPRKSQRRLTTREEANYQCSVQGCGKLFSRSYNYKAHLETHDDQREYPFPCQMAGCDKKFVRRTDLQRHHQSVHAKERNHRCDYCGRLFARKDTLRRHMEDGCSRRFELDSVPVRTDSRTAVPSDCQRVLPGEDGRRSPLVPYMETLPPLVNLPPSSDPSSSMPPSLSAAPRRA